jgi:hypothetical protein
LLKKKKGIGEPKLPLGDKGRELADEPVGKKMNSSLGELRLLREEEEGELILGIKNTRREINSYKESGRKPPEGIKNTLVEMEEELKEIRRQNNKNKKSSDRKPLIIKTNTKKMPEKIPINPAEGKPADKKPEFDAEQWIKISEPEEAISKKTEEEPHPHGQRPYSPEEEKEEKDKKGILTPESQVMKRWAGDLEASTPEQKTMKDRTKEPEVLTPERQAMKEWIKEPEIFTPERQAMAKRTGEHLMEKAEKDLSRAREEYVAALLAKEKIEKEEGKLTGIRAKIKNLFVKGFGSYEGEKEYKAKKEERLGGVALEKKNAEEILSKAQETLMEVLKNYRTETVSAKTRELEISGKTKEEINKEIEGYAREILLATTRGEAAKIENLKADRQIEQMGAARKLVNEKTEKFTGWYKNLPLKAKIAVSAGLAAAGIAGGLVGSTAIISAAFAGQGALRVLGGSLTAGGLEQLMKGSQERKAEKKLSKEFEGKFLETLKGQNEDLGKELFEALGAKKGEKNRRFVLAGLMGALVGGGLLAQAVRESLDVVPSQWKGAVLDKLGPEKPFAGGAKGAGALPEAAGAVSEKGGIKLPIGSRGPEGAITDYFKGNHEAARQFGWDGKADIKKWAGTKAHELWLENAKKVELKNPKVLAQLEKLGYSQDIEGYTKMMQRIGKGAVEINPNTGMNLAEAEMEYLRAPKGSAVDSVDLPSPPDLSEAETPKLEVSYSPTIKSLEKVPLDTLFREYSTIINSGMFNDQLATAFESRKSLGFNLADTFTEFRDQLKTVEVMRGIIDAIVAKDPGLLPAGYEKLTFTEFLNEAAKNKLLGVEVGKYIEGLNLKESSIVLPKF